MIRAEKMVQNLMDKITRMFGDDLSGKLSSVGDDPRPFSSVEWIVPQKSMEDIPAALMKRWIATWGYSVQHEFKNIGDEWLYIFTISWK